MKETMKKFGAGLLTAMLALVGVSGVAEEVQQPTQTADWFSAGFDGTDEKWTIPTDAATFESGKLLIDTAHQEVVYEPAVIGKSSDKVTVKTTVEMTPVNALPAAPTAQAAFTLLKKDEGLAYCGLAKVNDAAAWVELTGAAPVEDATVTLTAEFDYSAKTVTYKVGDTALSDGSTTALPLADATKTAVSSIAYTGSGVASLLVGDYLDADRKFAIANAQTQGGYDYYVTELDAQTAAGRGGEYFAFNSTGGWEPKTAPAKSDNFFEDATIANLWHVANATGLAEFRDAVNGGESFAGKTVVLDVDIDMASVDSWTPIGTNEHPFSGVFDGQNHTISNLKHTGAETASQVGLFGLVKGVKNADYTGVSSVWENETFSEANIAESKYTAVVKNIVLADVAIENTDSTYRYTGALVGEALNAYIANVSVTGAVTGPKGVGGVVGSLDGSVAKNCANSATVTATGYNVGGIAGGANYCNSDTAACCAFIGCSNDGKVTTTSDGGHVGGIVGMPQSGTCVVVTGCSNSGEIHSVGASSTIGGISGQGIALKVIVDCTNTGTLTSETTVGNAGGIAGYATAKVYNCDNMADITISAGALAGVYNFNPGQGGDGACVNCSNVGTLTNTNSEGETYPIGGGVKASVYSGLNFENVAALNAFIAANAGDATEFQLKNCTVTDPSGTLALPSSIQSVIFDQPLCAAVDASTGSSKSLAINIPSVAVSATANKETLFVKGANSIVTVANGATIGFVSVSGNGSKVVNDGTIASLNLDAAGTVEVENNGTLGKLNFNNTGTYNVVNKGTISHQTDDTNIHANEHTVDTIVAAKATIDNYGTIEAKANASGVCSYALLFYGGANVVINSYKDSVISADKNGCFIACGSAEAVTLNVEEGAVFKYGETSFTPVSSGKLTVQPMMKPVAEIVETGAKYPTLQAAADAAVADNTIKLLRDYTVGETENVAIKDGVAFTADTYTLTCTGAGSVSVSGVTKFSAGTYTGTLVLGKVGEDTMLTTDGLSVAPGGVIKIVDGSAVTLSGVGFTSDSTSGSFCQILDSLSEKNENLHDGYTLNLDNADGFKVGCIYLNGGSQFNVANGTTGAAINWTGGGDGYLNAYGGTVTIDETSDLATTTINLTGLINVKGVLDSCTVNIYAGITGKQGGEVKVDGGAFTNLYGIAVGAETKSGDKYYIDGDDQTAKLTLIGGKVNSKESINNCGLISMDAAGSIETKNFTGNNGVVQIDMTGATADSYTLISASGTANYGTLGTNYKFAEGKDNGYMLKVVNNSIVAEKPVAKVDETSYLTLDEALQHATDGTTLTLLADVADIGTKTLNGITFDGAGHKITGASVLYCGAAKETTIQNVVFENIHNDTSKQSAIYGEGFSTGSITITGCTFDNVDWDAIQIVPAAGASGTVSITGNVFKHTDAAKSQKRYVHIEKGASGAAGSPIKLTITDNKFLDVAAVTPKIETICLDRVAYIVGTTTLNGNYYSDSTTIWIPETVSGGIRLEKYYPNRSNPDQDVDDVPVPKFSIGAVGYDTLEAAVIAANAANVSVGIEVNADLTISSTCTTPINNATGKLIYFSVNGHTIIAETTILSAVTSLCMLDFTGLGYVVCPDSDPVFSVTKKIENCDKVVFSKDVSDIVNPHQNACVKQDDSHYAYFYLSRDDVAVSYGYCVKTSYNSMRQYYSKNVSDAVNDYFESNPTKSGVSVTFLADATGDVEISGKYVSFTAKTFTYTGSIKLDANQNFNPNGGTMLLSNLECGTMNVSGNSAVTIDNGKVNALNLTAGTLVIKGGIYGFDPKDYVDTDNYDVVKNGDGTWTVQEKVAVAEIGETKYYTLAEAVDAANAMNANPIMIDLLCDIEVTETLEIDNVNKRMMTFNAKGHHITAGTTMFNVKTTLGFVGNANSIPPLPLAVVECPEEGEVITVEPGGTLGIQNTMFSKDVSGLLDPRKQICIKNGSDYYEVIPLTDELAREKGYVVKGSVDNTDVYYKTIADLLSDTAKTSVTINLINDVEEDIAVEKHVTLYAGDYVYSGSVSLGSKNFNQYSGTANLSALNCDWFGIGYYGGYGTVSMSIADGNVSEFDVYTYGELSITGGTYGKDPTKYVDAKACDVVKNDDGTWTVQAKAAYVAEVFVGDVSKGKYETVQAAIAAVTEDGATVKLLTDVELDAVLNGGAHSITIDGDGHTFTQKADVVPSAPYHWFCFGAQQDPSGVDKSFTFKNATIDGFTSGTYMFRVEECSVTLDNVTFNECAGTYIVLFTHANGTVRNCVFSDNDASDRIIDFNSNADEDGYNDVFVMDNCLIQDNVANGTAIVGFAEDKSVTISNCSFIGNTLNSVNNSAPLYLGDQCGTCTGSLFKDNVVNFTTSSGYDNRVRAAGAIFTWASGTPKGEISGNAFVNNTVVKQNANFLTCYAKSVYSGGYYADDDLAGNYWDGHKPVIAQKDLTSANNDIYAEYDAKVVTASTYAMAYELNSDNYGVTVTLPTYVAEIFVGEESKGKYETLDAAIKAAAAMDSEEWKDIELQSCEITESIKLPATLKNVTFYGHQTDSEYDGTSVLKDMTITSYDGSAYTYDNVAFFGVVFDNSRIVITGGRDGTEVNNDWCFANNTFRNLKQDGYSYLHFASLGLGEPAVNFTFEYNTVDGSTFASAAVLNISSVSGEVLINCNEVSNLLWRPFNIQIDNDDDIDDTVEFVNNTFTANGRDIQVLTRVANGQDNVCIGIVENIFNGGNAEAFAVSDSTGAAKIDLTHNYYAPTVTTVEYNDASIEIRNDAVAADLPHTGYEYLKYMGEPPECFSYYTGLTEDGEIDPETLVEVKKAAAVCQIVETGVEYPTLQAAVDAAAEGDVIKLIDDISYDYPTESVMKNGAYGGAKGKALVFDLNGYAITAKIGASFTGTARDLIYNNGTLTVTDSVGTGSITIAESDDQGWSCSVSIFGNTGKMTIGAGTFANNGAASMSYVVDNRCGWCNQDAELAISGGTFVCPIYTAVRAYQQASDSSANEPYDVCKVTVTGGTFSGKRCFYLHQPNAEARANTYVDITGGSFTAAQRVFQIDVSGLAKCTFVNINGGEFSCGDAVGNSIFHVDEVKVAEPVEGSATITVAGGKFACGQGVVFEPVSGKEIALVGDVTGGIYSVAPAGTYVAEGYEVVSNPDEKTKDVYPWKVGEVSTDVAAVISADGTTTNKYATLQAAVDAANAGEIVKLLANVAENIEVAADKDFTLDLDGKTFVGVEGVAKALIDNKGKVIVTGAGEMVQHHGAKFVSAAVIENRPGGVMTIVNGTYRREQVGGSYYVIINHGEMTINGGTVIGDADSAMVENGWYSGGSTTSTLTINGGDFRGVSYALKNDDYGVLKITGGRFSASDNTTILSWSDLEISGGVFMNSNTAYALVTSGDYYGESDVGKLVISGGEFVASKVAICYCPDGGESDGIIDIRGGLFKAEKLISGDDGAVACKVSGGVYTIAPDAKYVASGYEVQANAEPFTKDDYPWAVAKKAFVPAEDPETGKVEPITIDITPAGGTQAIVPVTVSEDAVAKMVKNDIVTPAGKKATAAEVSEGLAKTQANDQTVWQNYVMGIDGTTEQNVLSTIGEKSADKPKEVVVVKTPIAEFKPPQNTGVTVTYNLLRKRPGETKFSVFQEGLLKPEVDVNTIELDVGDTLWKFEAVFSAEKPKQ